MSILDTTQYKDCFGTFIANLVLQILSWMAEEEREGVDAALQNGVTFGRPKAELNENFIEIYSMEIGGNDSR
ncbi:hypothetical protein [Bacillus sp. AFS055030]|uniref:hypothetical protein n=1 Tax=Bacillus sp. AFS055030 TaxID=2033507 RepID=UPI0025708698|nr:hypothetical protein [Bacillus sp. AFS055030]